MIKVSNKDLTLILTHLLGASIEIEHLKPHVGDSQLKAALTIKKHMYDINELIAKQPIQDEPLEFPL